MGLSAELRLSESLEKFSVAVVAMDDGRFAYQVFLVCGEPRTLLIDGVRYLTPDDAAQAGYEAAASISETPVRRPYAPSSPPPRPVITDVGLTPSTAPSRRRA
jgi:hypothetical protein